MRSAMKANQSALAGGSSGGSSGPNAGGGLGRTGLGTSGGQRLPVSPRERKPALAALAVLLILGGALASAYLVMASGQRVSAIRIAQPVAAGQQIPQSALEEVQVGDTGVQFINWSERLNVSRYYASVPLVKGALLTNGMISRTDEAAKGRLVVGLALKPGQLPSGGVESGKKVTLYAVGNGSGGGPRAGTVLAAEAIVINVGGGGGDRLRSDQTTVDVAVAPGDAPQVTEAASAGTVAIALIPDGTKAPGQPAGGTPGKQQPSPGGSQPPAGTGGGTPGAGSGGSPGTGGN
ncbi:hypothetical protein [Actinomadura verrucosospora]|uniref:SAF domain-containing protein n=1 Tax=Actinomadura verrucosospora TaxID=46165 RepID=A0A7D3W392_ACTVE|nr:hypothetical protein [Actinomadura verrucosospora]QKG25031.1 hypothetical protein ACTIVE_6682 [Actinomadura verrucosospora]